MAPPPPIFIAAAAVLLATFGLTLVRDLTTGILAGCFMAAIFALFRPPLASEDG